MKSTKTKILKEDGIIVSSGRTYSEDSYQKMMKKRQAYIKDNYRRFNFRLRNDTYEALIKHLENQANLTEYLKILIIKDLLESVKEDEHTDSENLPKQSVYDSKQILERIDRLMEVINRDNNKDEEGE